MIWTVLGISVAIISLFCITLAELVVDRPYFQEHKLLISALLGAAGVVAYFAGRFLAGRRSRALKVANSDQNEEASPVFLLFDLQYWGPLLVVLGIIVIFIRPFKLHRPQTATPVAPPPRRAVVVVTSAPPPAPVLPPPVLARMPEIKVQGIIYRPNEAAAIIEGKTFMVGDQIQDAEIVSITREGVTLRAGTQISEFRLEP